MARIHLLRLVIHGEFEPFLGLGASTLRSLTGTLSRVTLVRRGIAVSDLVLPPGMLLGDGSAFLELRGRLVQKRREALCGPPHVVHCGPGRAGSLCLYGTTLAPDGLASDRGLLSEPLRLVALQRLSKALQLPCLVLGLAGGYVALIGATFAPIR